jgi:hypothetical protein
MSARAPVVRDATGPIISAPNKVVTPYRNVKPLANPPVM